MFNPHHYVKDGKTVLLVDSDIPGLTLIPEGFEREDAIGLEKAEAEKIQQQFIDDGKNHKELDVVAELTKLRDEIDNQKTEIEKLKQKK